MKIAVLYIDEMLATSALNVQELWHAASQTMRSLHFDSTQRFQATDLKLVTLGVNHINVVSGSGMAIPAQATLADNSDAFNFIYIPALWRNPSRSLRKNRNLLSWLQSQYANNATITATGTGVCFMAEAGLLNNRPATTHWHYFDQFSRNFPQVQLKRQHFVTESDSLYCAASINALADVVIHHVHRVYGRGVSDHLSRHFSAEARKPIEHLRFSEERHADEEILQVQIWLQDHFQESTLTIKALANRFGYSERNFNRRFLEATGTSARQYLIQLRLNQARELLSKTNLNVNEVAQRIGFNEPSYFCRQFKRFTGQTPINFRTVQRAKLFELSPSRAEI